MNYFENNVLVDQPDDHGAIVAVMSKNLCIAQAVEMGKRNDKIAFAALVDYVGSKYAVEIDLGQAFQDGCKSAERNPPTHATVEKPGPFAFVSALERLMARKAKS